MILFPLAFLVFVWMEESLWDSFLCGIRYPWPRQFLCSKLFTFFGIQIITTSTIEVSFVDLPRGRYLVLCSLLQVAGLKYSWSWNSWMLVWWRKSFRLKRILGWTDIVQYSLLLQTPRGKRIASALIYVRLGCPIKAVVSRCAKSFRQAFHTKPKKFVVARRKF